VFDFQNFIGTYPGRAELGTGGLIRAALYHQRISWGICPAAGNVMFGRGLQGHEELNDRGVEPGIFTRNHTFVRLIVTC